MAAPTESFNVYYCTRKNGFFYVGDYAGKYTVQDSADFGKLDNLSQLGDVTGDHFKLTGNIGEFDSTYFGTFGKAKSFIGSIPGGYILFTPYSNAYSGQNSKIFSSYNNAPFDIVCFAAGTRISTFAGGVEVERLQVGDLVATASGEHRIVRWLGHRAVDCRHHPHPHEVMPIRVAAHAFGSGLPVRDLLLSPGHPVLVGADADNEGGHLVPVMCLINGTTIARMPVDEVTYWHVELDEHDILLAEGLPAESYLDWGDRRFFDESADHALANPDFVVPGLAGRCRPVAIDGPVVEAERRRLDTVFALRLSNAAAWPVVEEGAFLI